jgi:cleavage stimulation factor subunit 3
MLATVSQAHMTAKTNLRELREFLKLVMSPEPAVIPGQTPKFDLPVPPTFSITEKSYRDQWLRYLQWEEGNQLEFELASDTGRKEYITRVRGVYRRASVRMRFYGEVW